MEPFKVLQTFHKDGILHSRFSNDGVFLVTIGADPLFSIQVFNWKNEETIAFRNTTMMPIFDIIFNPYNKYEFTTVGHHNIAIWGLQGRSLNRKKWIQLKPVVGASIGPKVAESPPGTSGSSSASYPILTCAAYLNYHVKES